MPKLNSKTVTPEAATPVSTEVPTVEQAAVPADAKPRYKFLDVLKILSIVLVVYIHSGGLLLYIPNQPELVKNIEQLVNCFAFVCVPLFFMVNGALLFNRELDFKKHVIKTLKTFLLVYFWAFVILLLQMPIRYLLDYGEKIDSVYEFFKSCIQFKYGWNNHLWFLAQLVLLYLFFPLLKLLFDKNKKYFAFFLGLVFIFTIFSSVLESFNWLVVKMFGSGAAGLTNAISSLFNDFKYHYYPAFSTQAYALVYFMAGGLILFYAPQIKAKLASKKIFFNILSVIVIVAMNLIGYWYYTNINPTGEGVEYANIYTCVITVTLFLIGMMNDDGRSNPKITFVAKNIMGVYLLHHAIQYYISYFVGLLFDFDHSSLRLVLTALTLAACFGLTVLLNKVKYVKELLKL